MFDVIALGELLIDFTENGTSSQGNLLLEANPGGAPCNVLAMLNKLGKKTAFIGKVGSDFFGILLKETLISCGIDTSNLLFDPEVHTTLAFVHTKPDGDREFGFYRNPGADMMLRQEEVSADLLGNGRIFHFGTLSSTHEEVRKATRFAVETAKKNNGLISFDPNLRESLWDCLDHAKEEISYGLSQCDILKISDHEIEFMTGHTDYERGARELQSQYHIPLVFVTLGKKGSLACWQGQIVYGAPFLLEHTIETTGAGDTFTGCALSYLLDHDIRTLTKSELEELLTFANAGAALITTRKGALRVMPEREEILSLVNSRSL